MFSLCKSVKSVVKNKQDIEKIKRLGKATDVFYFKQFRVKDDRSTMKVGTDAVLLGVAADVAAAQELLEVGTGSGVIALCLAQRSQARIDAIDIDRESAEQARENAVASPWAERIRVIHVSFQEFAATMDKKYDLIVSNPPYFSRSLKSGHHRRNISRHNDLLGFEELIALSAQLLTGEGSLWVVLPLRESAEFMNIATTKEWHLHYRLSFIPREGKAANRVVLGLKRTKTAQVREDLLVHRNSDGDFSDGFIRFMKDFYVDF